MVIKNSPRLIEDLKRLQIVGKKGGLCHPLPPKIELGNVSPLNSLFKLALKCMGKFYQLHVDGVNLVKLILNKLILSLAPSTHRVHC